LAEAITGDGDKRIGFDTYVICPLFKAFEPTFRARCETFAKTV